MTKLFSWILLIVCFIMPWTVQAESNGLVNVHQEFNAFKHDFLFDPKLLKSALDAYDCGIAAGYSGNPYILTIVDYQLPSYDKRLWVLDLANHRVLYHTYVAHGAGSGKVDATHFSNKPSSQDSSIGLYDTGVSYFGAWGYAMRLYGLEPGYNSNAFRRDIVMHGGGYVSNRSIELHGMIGMSHGCFAVPVTLDHNIIDTLKDGSLIFAYYPDPWWLAHSHYLHCSVLHEFDHA
jgi:hypothetical protein